MKSNGGAQNGMYLDITGKQYKKDQEWEKKGERIGFKRSIDKF